MFKNYKRQVVGLMESLRTTVFTVSFTACAFLLHYATAQSISAGKFHSLGSSKDGKIYSWGTYENDDNSDPKIHLTPVDVSGTGDLAGKTITSISAGAFFSMALTTEGKVIAWNIPNAFSPYVVIDSNVPKELSGLSDIKAISAGAFHALVLKEDGTVYAFGQGENGELGNGSFAPTSPGTVNVNQVTGLSDVTDISAGNGFSLALTSDGSVYSWGNGTMGQLGNGVFYDSAERGVATPQKILEGIIAISAGGNHAMAVTVDKYVFTWGDGRFGQLGDGQIHENTAYGRAVPWQVQDLGGIMAVDAGDYFSLALDLEGNVFSWGEGSSGNLGFDGGAPTGGTFILPTPHQVPGLKDIIQISAGRSHALFLHKTGVVLGLGQANWGQLGDGVTEAENDYAPDTRYFYSPVQAKDLDLIPETTAHSGKILWEQWLGVNGDLQSIPFNTNPDSKRLLSLFEAPETHKDFFGSRISGYITAPETGNYTFFIASDDESELWLSTSDNPSAKMKIASVTGHTAKRQWNKYPSQKSGEIYLEEGKKYYIEAIHKENRGFDNLSVAWLLPGGELEAPIPGERLTPEPQNESLKPFVEITNPLDGYSYPRTSGLTITVEASYQFGDIYYVELYNESGLRQHIDYTYPYTFDVGFYEAPVPVEKMYIARAVAEDFSSNSDTVTFYLTEQHLCNEPGSGFVYWYTWNNLPSGGIFTIPVDTEPDQTYILSDLETPRNRGSFYGSLIKGYICPPYTGEYTFLMASDDHSELWLSSDDQQSNKTKIAYVNGSTNHLQFNKFSSQTSNKIVLEAGRRYYFEVLHKENQGFDHLSVRWIVPGSSSPEPVGLYWNSLSPYLEEPGSVSARIASAEPQHLEVKSEGLSAFPNPSNGAFQVNFTADETAEALLQLFTLDGRFVDTYYKGFVEKEKFYSVDVNTLKIPKGIYICRLTQGKKVKNIKMVIM